MNKYYSKHFSFFENLILLFGGILKYLLSRIPGYAKLYYRKKLFTKLQDESYKIKRAGDCVLIYRNFESQQEGYYLRSAGSDLMVLQQVILEKEYQPLLSLAQGQKKSIKTIIDLGANIGISSIYLNKIFPCSIVYAVEPEPSNYNILLKNIELNKDCDIRPINAAIWYRDEVLENTASFRDRQNWSNQTLPTGSKTGIRGVTLDSIVNGENISTIDILKIDIEGAEKQLFMDYKNIMDILQITDIIAIEIHDEVADRNMIYEKLIQGGFSILNSGETTFAFRA